MQTLLGRYDYLAKIFNMPSTTFLLISKLFPNTRMKIEIFDRNLNAAIGKHSSLA